MFCTKCGKEIKEGAKFCTGCGTPVSAVKPAEKPKPAGAPAPEKVVKAPAQEKVVKSPTTKKVIEKKGGLPIAAIIAIIVGVILFVGVVAFGAYYVANNVLDKDSKIENEEIVEDDTVDQESDKGDGKNDDSVSAPVAEAPATEEPAEEVPAEEEAAEVDWKALYIEKLDEFADTMDNGNYPNAGLIFVDDDNIPELVLLGADEASGNRVYTCASGKLDELITSRLYFTFIERGNAFLNSDGHMGYYFDTLYAIENGVWVLKEDGSYVEDYENTDPNKGYFDYIYSWGADENITPEDYRNRLEGCFNDNEAVIIPYEYECSLSDLKKQLEGDSYEMAKLVSRYYIDSAAIHDYEFIIDDVSWYTAFSDCQERGGYLARINSREEFDYITEKIKENGMEKNVFWVAGTRGFGPAAHYRWMTNSYSSEAAKLDVDPEYKDMWMDGEPSYVGENADGLKVSEEYLDLFYLKSQDRFVLNDVEEDISAYYPGKIGYICEYE